MRSFLGLVFSVATVAACSSFASERAETTPPADDAGAADAATVDVAQPPPPPPGLDAGAATLIAQTKGPINGIATTANFVYYTDQSDNSLRSVPIGAAVVRQPAQLSGNPHGVSTSGSVVFVAVVGTSKIARYDEAMASPAEADVPSPPAAILANVDWVFWTALDGKVYKSGAGGLGNIGLVADVGGSPQGLVADTSHLWFASSSSGAVWQANLDGTGAQPIYTGQNDVRLVAIANGKLHWYRGSDQSLIRADGASVAQLATTVGDVRALVGDDTYLYWQDGTSTYRWRADGMSPKEPLGPSSYAPGSTLVQQNIAVTPTAVYFADSAKGDIYRLTK